MSITPVDDSVFPTWVRNWIHYDTLASSLYKQAINARKVRTGYEDKIMESLERRKMMNAVLQLKQGKYHAVEEVHNAPFSFAAIEGILHAYYKSKGASARDETLDIIAFMKQHRQQTRTVRLRKLEDHASNLPAPPDQQLE
jgi:hypothetical protein